MNFRLNKCQTNAIVVEKWDKNAANSNNDPTTFVITYDDNLNYQINFQDTLDNSEHLSTRQDREYQDGSSESDNNSNTEEETFDSWSVVWYIASFGGLIGFFLVVSCSEWCCRKHIRENQSSQRSTDQSLSRSASTHTESPPPAYDLFAPPSYDSLAPSSNEKHEYDIYVVPVHAIGSLVESESRSHESPPSYSSINVESDSTTNNAGRT
ncbi:hypothetical protein MML48_5g00021347 [Holotrichia oblita]|uniref:Uncharacterized protein n=1 Tax=Holotrichia oblita TaxID=644536 RepID=A0ACB9T3A5_HOLOL|nr:hypothetical protein MML48_5g00021347 [Holotrichia oblita]